MQRTWLLLCTMMEPSAAVALVAGEHGVGTWFWLLVGLLSFSPCGTCWGRKVQAGFFTHMLGPWAGMTGAAGG